MRKNKKPKRGSTENKLAVEPVNDEMTVRVTCRANSTIGLDDIHPLQGDLKSLSDDDFTKLKKSILKYGISFPIFLWQQENKARILDGTQRDKVLKRMRADGYKIPPLPIDWIEAADEKEAKEKILLISSQYGRMTEDSLYQFVAGGDLDFNELFPLIEFPQLDLEALRKVLTDSSGTVASPRITLADAFGVPPFSVLDARQGYWQERKAFWIGLGIQSELGRGSGVTWGTSDAMTDESLNFYRKQNKDGLLGFSEQARSHYKNSPGGSPRPAAKLRGGRTVRGDGKGRPFGVTGGSPEPLAHFRAGMKTTWDPKHGQKS